MTKEQKNQFDNLYNFYDNVDEEKERKNKIKERNKRINQRKIEQNDKFDFDTEIVIGMTNKNNEKKNEEQQKKMTKKQAQILRKKKKIKRIIKLITLLMIIIGGIVFALVSPIFNIKEIYVVKNEQISSDTIVSLSQLKIGQNIFKYSSRKVEKEIKTNPYIESVNIKRKFPDKIEITVKERQKNYNVEFLNGYAYINNQGYILEISEQKLELPIVQGISTEEEKIVEGNRLNEQDLSRLEVIIQIMNICETYDLDKKVSKIDISDKNNYIIHMEEEKKTVYIGDESNLSNKMLYIPTILEENKGKEGKIYIDKDATNKYKARFKENV
ncbi:MAG: FtsQ-type POTRA domain-containing protein [Clostridia bacterium]|nr:FtsQ-type POTRA domain-containing protein [Clostridia bacterium]